MTRTPCSSDRSVAMHRYARIGAALALSGFAAATFAQEELAKKYACTACHTVDKKLVGPAFHDIAVKYADGSVSSDELAKRIKAGSTGKWGPIPMPAQVQVPDADLKSLAAWVLSNK